MIPSFALFSVKTVSALQILYFCYIWLFVATFKKMHSQEKVRQMKAFEKQEKQLKEMKAAGKSSKQAVSLWDLYYYISCLIIEELLVE